MNEWFGCKRYVCFVSGVTNPKNMTSLETIRYDVIINMFTIQFSISGLIYSLLSIWMWLLSSTNYKSDWAFVPSRCNVKVNNIVVNQVSKPGRNHWFLLLDGDDLFRVCNACRLRTTVRRVSHINIITLPIYLVHRSLIIY